MKREMKTLLCKLCQQKWPGIKDKDVEQQIARFVVDVCGLNAVKGTQALLAVVADMCNVLEQARIYCSNMKYKTRRTRDSQAGLMADASMSLDELLKLLTVAFEVILSLVGPNADPPFTSEEITQCDADFRALIATIEGLEHRDIEAETGAELIVRDFMKLLNDLRVNPVFPTGDTPTELDAVLETLRAVLDGALETWGPDYNLDSYTIARIEADLAGLEQDVRDIEHGRVPLTDGLVKIVDDVFNMLRDFGVPVLSADAPGGLAVKAASLRQQLEVMMTVLYPEAPLDSIQKLEVDLMALDAGRDGLTLFEVVYDLAEIGRQFSHAVGYRLGEDS